MATVVFPSVLEIPSAWARTTRPNSPSPNVFSSFKFDLGNSHAWSICKVTINCVNSLKNDLAEGYLTSPRHCYWLLQRQTHLNIAAPPLPPPPQKKRKELAAILEKRSLGLHGLSYFNVFCEYHVQTKPFLYFDFILLFCVLGSTRRAP